MSPENAEFLALFVRAGWNQSEAARNLELSSASVSRYVNGVDRPARPTLALFRRLLEPARPAPIEPWAEGLLRDLRALSDSDRAAVLDTVAAKLTQLAKPAPARASRSARTSGAALNFAATSKVAAAARAGASAAVRLARESAPKPKAAAPTARRAAPKPSARPGSR